MIHHQTNPPFRILVVDDEPDLLRLYAEGLVNLGYEVDAAENGAKAWDVLQQNKYDLLITDNRMPKLTGVDLLKKLHDHQKSLPAIMVTGTMPSEGLGYQPWFQVVVKILKPHTMMDLSTAVKNVLRTSAIHHIAA